MTVLTLVAGFLSAYHQAPTDATIAARQQFGHIPASLAAYDGVIAVQDCGLVGQPAWLVTDDELLRVMVFDCAGHDDGGYAWMDDNNIAAEMGWYLWQDRPDLLGQRVTVMTGIDLTEVRP